ncbi:serine/threonine protein kinase [Tolypothrix campylonemoides VB511288]|nr:serine/threonine protein kinase [Tolypothrix campylonemoides VB511288]
MIPEIEPGTIIHSRYQIQKLLGKGEFGRTYLAFDNQRFDEPCVLKELVPKTSKEENLCKFRNLFEREAKVLYQIEHPQVPKFLAWFTDNQRMFIIQQYVNGKTYSEILSDRIAKIGQPFSETEVRTWLMDVLSVLEYLHERKIIHRDISLDNIMQPHNQSKPVLIDFGAVKENFTQIISSAPLSDFNSTRYSVIGRFGYSPPELLRLGLCYPSSDFYALGVCAVILLTGKMPHLLLDELLNWQWRSHVSICDDFEIILHKMLAQQPIARFQSAQEIILALNNLHSNSLVLPRFQFPVTPPIEEIQNPQKEKENKKALEELSILQNLELKLRESNDTNDNISPPSSIYLNLDLSEYIKQKSRGDIENYSRGINIRAIGTKINNIWTRMIAKYAAKKHVGNNKNFPKINTQEFWENMPANNLHLLEIIKQELTNFIGPIASVIINDSLAFYPDCSLKELIEILAAEIPDKLTAEQFQKDIYNLIKTTKT